VCRWLASKGQHEAAEQALRRLRGPDQIEADLAEMQAAAEEESKARSWTLLRSPAVRGELQVGQTLRPVVVFILVCHALVVRPVAVSIVVCHALEVRPFVVSIVVCHALEVRPFVVSIVVCHALVAVGILSGQCSSSDSPTYQGTR